MRAGGAPRGYHDAGGMPRQETGEWPLKSPIRPGYFLEALLLEGDPTQSEGLYRFDHWAVRLGCDPRSAQARMATLHEMYHGLLNDSTAYGTLLHVAGLLVREQPSVPHYASLLACLLDGARDTHETYATYSSVFLVGRGRCDPTLVDAYPGYPSYLTNALEIAGTMPNPLLGFQLVQSVTRAAMQPDCLTLFAPTPPEQWIDVAARPDLGRPDQRLTVLRSASFLQRTAEAFSHWADAQTDPLVHEVLNTRPKTDAEYDRLIDKDLDSATDVIGAYLYDLCCAELHRVAQTCLAFNGHQAHTAAILARVAHVLPEGSARRLNAAPEGSRLDDLLSGFAQERLVVVPARIKGRWAWLDDLPEERWPELLVGPTAHAFIVVRPSSRLQEQYVFDASEPLPRDASGAFVAVRRRAIETDGRATVEYMVLRDPEQLDRLSERLKLTGRTIASCAMSILAAEEWQSAWLPALRRLSHFDVLIDLDPFQYVRAWARQSEFVTAFTTMTARVGDREHMALALRPDSDGGIVFLAPCTSVFCSAMAVELRSLAAEGAPFAEDTGPFESEREALILVLSHLFLEEPWFDFRAAVPLAQAITPVEAPA